MLNPPLDKNAFALRPVRMLTKRNEFRYYEATTFPANPFNGCSMCLRRCFDDLKEDDSNLLIDVLDENGDTIQEYPITRKGFNYLRRVLKFKIEHTPSNNAHAGQLAGAGKADGESTPSANCR
jgi:hypothetical protein